MARKPQRRMPQVPRSTVQSAPTPRESAVAASADGASASIEQMMEHEYAHVRGDLLRIGTFAALIFSIMLILRFVVGL